MATNFLNLATTLENLGARWLLEKKVNFVPCESSVEFLPSTVSVNLSVVALPIVPKVEFIFEIMLYIVIFLDESTGSCFKSVIGNQDSLKSTPIVLFSRR